MKICQIVDCSNTAIARSWCDKHYRRWKKHGDPVTLVRHPQTICKICSEPAIARNFCERHYDKYKRYGDALIVRHIRNDDVARFWSKVNKTDTCWLWMGALDSSDYGAFRVGKRTVLAHRYSYELTREPIPPSLQLDHLCFVRRCVNPEHLEPVTGLVNVRRVLERKQHGGS